MNQNQEILYNKLFINNTFVDGKNGKKYEIYNPTTGKLLCHIVDGDQMDVDYAVECAKRTYYNYNSEWRLLDGYQRGRYLYKLADLMDHHRDTLCNLETMDHGKPYQYVRRDVDYAIQTLRYYAGYADKYYGKQIPLNDNNYTCYTKCEAYGVVGLILSSNNPLLKFICNFAPAFAAGNCIVVKPCYQAPLTCLYVAHLTKLVGFPDGVFNVVTGGKNTGRYIVTHKDIHKLTFNGQTRNGKDVMENNGRCNFMKNLTFKLSANNALIVFRDYDLNDACNIAHHNLFYNQGQNTSSAHRVYVHEDIYDEFVKRSINMVRNIKIGTPFDHGTQYGPQVDENKMNRILNFIETTKKEGGRLECGGKRYGSQGFYIEPTIFTNCHDNMRCAYEDLYGPVQYIFKFKTNDEVIERLNHCHYGYAVGVLTYNMDHYHYFANKLEYGNVWFNDYQTIRTQTPVGRFKLSGWGYDNGVYGLHEYLRKKTVTYKNTNHVNTYRHKDYEFYDCKRY